ncbi:hypothetical protein [Candidatus Protofrankia californiensis]|uniref:hypothetical protein n=1 Tax=Candidatus Protofrankia californiensis TaxID=1839754 RepID=UPI001F49A5BE|nr:hypothetical protein [Candidatus Protofrankia californiensis]
MKGVELQVAVRAPGAAVEHDHDRTLGQQGAQRDVFAVDVGQGEVGRGCADGWRAGSEATGGQLVGLRLERVECVTELFAKLGAQPRSNLGQ